MSAPLSPGGTEAVTEVRSIVTMPSALTTKSQAEPGDLPGMTSNRPATGAFSWARTLAMRLPGTRPRRQEMVMAVFQSAAESMARLDHKCGSECLTDCPLPADRAHSSRFFQATADQVRVVRAFARARLAGHPARDDAVLVASELAANSCNHSASGHGGGWILVHLSEVSATHAAVLITERRGIGEPMARDADADSESGRGLAMVRSLSCFFRVSENGDVRNILAVVPADPSAVTDPARGKRRAHGSGYPKPPAGR
jgi:anti-sigma regulatory factor (Ser/Thr protein kinase)